MGGLGLIGRRRAIASSPTTSSMIKFVDPVVESICVANFSSDGVGVSYEDAAAVTSLGAVFKNNVNIVRFPELRFFTNVKELGASAFFGCKNLVEINTDNIEQIGQSNVFGETGIEHLNLPNIKTIGPTAFQDFAGHKVTLGANITSIDQYNFWRWKIAAPVIILAPNPPTVAGNNEPGWYGIKFYVPDEYLDNYKSWKYASSTFALSTLQQ